MRYVALLRGINVGTSKRIDMNSLKAVFEENTFTRVSTYINSGNVLFDSGIPESDLQPIIEGALKSRYGVDIKVLIKNRDDIIRIARAIPGAWTNDQEQKTDVAYLFAKADTADILDVLPVKKQFLELLYVEGALIWNIQRGNYNKSQVNKLISHELYQQMTVRNVNTARYLATAVQNMDKETGDA